MDGLTASLLLDAWETGMAEPVADQSPSLLRSLGWLDGTTALDDLTVGECDMLLLDLRAQLFGSRLGTVASCPRCHHVVEFELTTTDLRAGAGKRGPASVVFALDGYEVRCRLPTNADLRALTSLDRPVEVSDLVRQCALTVLGPAGAVPFESLSLKVAQEIVVALAELDAGASLQVLISCPCSLEWAEEFDIRSFLWAELTSWADRMLREVHELASCYGWPETEILRLSSWRRRAYREACGW
jgi:hypothetical protein